MNKLFAGLGSVRIVKNCDLGLENAALGLRPRAAFSRPRSQFFTVRTSQPANNIYIFSPPCNILYIYGGQFVIPSAFLASCKAVFPMYAVLFSLSAIANSLYAVLSVRYVRSQTSFVA